MFSVLFSYPSFKVKDLSKKTIKVPSLRDMYLEFELPDNII